MANAAFTMSAPPNPGQLLYQQVANFLATGSPAFGTTAPSVRTATPMTSSGNTTSTSHTTSSSVVAGDLLLIFVASTSTPTVPIDFNYLGSKIDSSNQLTLYLFAKTAASTDISRTFAVATTAAGNTLVASMAYQHCLGIGFIDAIGLGSHAAANTSAAPSVSSFLAHCTVIDAFVTYRASSNAGITAPSANTSRAAFVLGTNALSVSDATLAAAGVAPTATATQASAQTPTWAAVSLILVPGPSGGTAPTSWSFVEDIGGAASYGAAGVWGAETIGVWKSSSASNTGATTWYLYLSFFAYAQSVGSASLSVAMSELYYGATHCGDAFASPNASAGVIPVSATTPPWAQVAGSGGVLLCQSGVAAIATITSAPGTTNVIVAANADGFFLTTLEAGSAGGCVFVGFGSSLVSNTAFTPDIFLGVADLLNHYMGTTRDYQSVTTVPLGSYNLDSFWPTADSFPGGRVNDTTYLSDLYQGAAGSPMALRILAAKSVGSGLNTQGGVRGLLPVWLQWLDQIGCAFSDTVTEGANTLTYTAQGSIWLNTSTA